MKVKDLFKGNPATAVGTITEFGGPHDTKDNGMTVCGFSTIEHPNFKYCALPIPVWEKYNLRCAQPVFFEHGASRVSGVLWDNGPTASLMRIADVLPIIMKALGGDGRLNNVRVIIGGNQT